MKKTVLVLAVVFMICATGAMATYGDWREKRGEYRQCVWDCIQVLNPGIPVGDGRYIPGIWQDLRECGIFCYSYVYKGECTSEADGCCNLLDQENDPEDCGIELPGLGDPCDPNVGCQAPYQCLPDELGDYFCSP